jgi:hypothetical protein
VLEPKNKLFFKEGKNKTPASLKQESVDEPFI